MCLSVVLVYEVFFISHFPAEKSPCNLFTLLTPFTKITIRAVCDSLLKSFMFMIFL